MRIEHIAMYVKNLEAARNFFVKYLGGVSNDGYHNKTTGFRSYFVSFEDGARLEIMNKPQMDNPEKTRIVPDMFIWLFRSEAKKKWMNLRNNCGKMIMKS